ncbi:MAG: DUF5691 domain-containing protein [Saezia sp.]
MKALWIKNALIGVNENTPLAADGCLGDYLRKVAAQPTEAAQNFSLGVGVWAACQQAAFAPAFPHDANIPAYPLALTEPALPEQHPATHTLVEILLGNNLRLTYEALALLEKQSLKLPSHLMAAALDAGRRNTEIRPIVLKSTGVLGAWLSRFNPNWKYAVTDLEEKLDQHDERLWHEGNFAQREEFFKQCRENKPAHARTLLENELKNLPAKERLAFVGQMEMHLCVEDEPLLSSLLRDRSGEVKDKAAELLARIPHSNYAQQIINCMQTLVLQKKGLIKTSWLCDAPESFLPEWKELALTEKPPAHYRLGGERSWWLFQLVVKTPLRWWHDYTGMSIHELVKWSQTTDWKDILRHGWQESISTDDTEWIQVLFEQPKLLETKHYSNLYATLKKNFSLLTDEARVALINRFPADVCSNWQLLQMLSEGLPLHATLPKPFSQAVLDTLKADYKASSIQNNYQKRITYQNLVWALHPEALLSWQKPEKPLTAESAEEIKWMQEIDLGIALRQKLQSQLSSLSDSITS